MVESPVAAADYISMFHVIDDQSYLADLLGELVISLGYDAKTFTDPREYLSYTRSEQFVMPVAVITDIDMPGMNGYRMMQEIHKTHPSLKFVAVTGEPATEDAYKSKACMYVSKPFRPEVLESVFGCLSDCSAHGPSTDIGCAGCDDRESFGLTGWLCPHPA